MSWLNAMKTWVKKLWRLRERTWRSQYLTHKRSPFWETTLAASSYSRSSTPTSGICTRRLRRRSGPLRKWIYPRYLFVYICFFSSYLHTTFFVSRTFTVIVIIVILCRCYQVIDKKALFGKMALCLSLQIVTHDHPPRTIGWTKLWRNNSHGVISLQPVRY